MLFTETWKAWGKGRTGETRCGGSPGEPRRVTKGSAELGRDRGGPPLTSVGSETWSWVSGGALITITICSEGSTMLRRSWQVT